MDRTAKALKLADRCRRRIEGATGSARNSLLREYLEFLRRYRIDCVLSRKSPEQEVISAYRQLVREVHGHLFSSDEFPGYGDLTPSLTGRSNFYAGRIEVSGCSSFLKVASTKEPNELLFYTASKERSGCMKGEAFDFQLPTSIVKLDVANAYIFPFLERVNSPSFDYRAQPNEVKLVVRAIADFNKSFGYFRQTDAPLILPKVEFDLPSDYERIVVSILEERDNLSLDAIMSKVLMVKERWKAVSDYAKTLWWSLAHGDPARSNLHLQGCKILFTDAGEAGFAPVGSDLYWLLYRNREHKKGVDDIVRQYHESISDHDHRIDTHQVLLGAEMRYLRKWLVPSKTGTRANVSHFNHCLDRALKFIDDLSGRVSGVVTTGSSSALQNRGAYPPGTNSVKRKSEPPLHSIEVLEVASLASRKVDDPEEIAVIMPNIDVSKSRETAELLVRRAGISCKIVLVEDTVRCGFIKTLNAAAVKFPARYIVYLAQDAFPGADWLCIAHQSLEVSGKGLLAFNDGKWRGRIAGFGMVRTEWVASLYGGPVLWPGYHAHKADNELTVIARATDQFVYNPDATLVEYDPAKVLVGTKEDAMRKRDRDLFKSRFRSGFEGLVESEALAELAAEYRMS